jgi:lysophospholipase L1-like esterase
VLTSYVVNMRKLLILIFCTPLGLLGQSIDTTRQVKFLALGDSYTIGQGVTVSERWPMQLATKIAAKVPDVMTPRIIATTGWRTDNLKNGIMNSSLPGYYSLVSLLIGVNDYYQGGSVTTYGVKFEELLKMAIALTNNRPDHVFVVSIPDYGFTPFGKSNQATISTGINLFNAKNEEITKRYNVAYYTITDISRRGLDEPDLVAIDGLHPSGKMYAEWTDRIFNGLKFTKEVPGEEPENPDPVTDVEGDQNMIQVFPNPSNHEITIKLINPEQQMFMHVFDSRGMLVLKASGDEKSINRELNAKDLPAGLYSYQISFRNQLSQSGKLIRN